MINEEGTSFQELRKIIHEVNEKVRTDPEIRRRMEELSRELSTIDPEDLRRPLM